jgi:hypothetical protein
MAATHVFSLPWYAIERNKCLQASTLQDHFDADKRPA